MKRKSFDEIPGLIKDILKAATRKKNVFSGFDQVCHKLDFIFSKRRDCTIRVEKTKCANQLCRYCTADLRFGFRIGKIRLFFMKRLIRDGLLQPGM